MSEYICYSNLYGREKLMDILPLKYPLSMIIDPCNICNFRCHFCPTGHPILIDKVKRPSGRMNLPLFKKIVDDTKDILPTDKDRVKRLFLDKDGEPLLNKDLFQMIRYVKEREVFMSVETATNGSLLNENTISEMVGSGLDIVRISIEAVNNLKYRDITGTPFSYDRIKENIESLFKERERQCSPLQIHVKTFTSSLDNENETKKFMNDFSDISDSCHIDSLVGWSHSDLFDFTLGNKIDYGNDSESEIRTDRMICNLPFRTLSVNWNGKVSVCCVDWAWGTVVGDLSKESLKDIWEGKCLYDFRMMHLLKRRGENISCGNCHYILGQNPLDELDGNEEVLMNIYAR